MHKLHSSICAFFNRVGGGSGGRRKETCREGGKLRRFVLGGLHDLGRLKRIVMQRKVASNLHSLVDKCFLEAIKALFVIFGSVRLFMEVGEFHNVLTIAGFGEFFVNLCEDLAVLDAFGRPLFKVADLSLVTGTHCSSPFAALTSSERKGLVDC